MVSPLGPFEAAIDALVPPGELPALLGPPYDRLMAVGAAEVDGPLCRLDGPVAGVAQWERDGTLRHFTGTPFAPADIDCLVGVPVSAFQHQGADLGGRHQPGDPEEPRHAE